MTVGQFTELRNASKSHQQRYRNGPNAIVAYSEILADERQETATGFWQRAQAFFAQAGITVTAAMTNNGACYRSRLFNDTLGETIKHRYTKPYRPQTNGKVERFNRTLAQEWAYAETYRSDEDRAANYTDWTPSV